MLPAKYGEFDSVVLKKFKVKVNTQTDGQTTDMQCSLKLWFY